MLVLRQISSNPVRQGVSGWCGMLVHAKFCHMATIKFYLIVQNYQSVRLSSVLGW